MASRPAGFTLLELLVALVIFGLILTILTQATHFGLLASRTEARLAGTDSDLNQADLLLRHLIEAADPGSEDENQAPLLASRDSMTFVTDLPNAGGGVPARQITATLLVDGHHRLMLRWRPFRRVEQLGPPPPLQETELLGGVSHIDLAFWRRSGGWVSGWNFTNLPVMIRVHLAFTSGTRRRWPDIVAVPKLTRR